MRLAVLFSGGKDSTYALFKEIEKHQIVCLITLKSKNDFSYMFHTPNINLTEMQAEALGLPLIEKETKGEEELELDDLIDVLKEAKEKFQIEGIITGAIESVYQASRIQKICDNLNLKCLNPIWKKDQLQLLNELIENKFEVLISGVAAYPLDNRFVGKILDKKMIDELKILSEKYKINPSGEGGELETTVLDCPIFKKKIQIESSEIVGEKHNHNFIIKKAKLIEK